MTENFVPGLTQSQTLTRAAQKLSAARERYQLAVEEDVAIRAADNLENAELAYKAAYKAYTNPFGVEKTYQAAPTLKVEEYTEDDVHVS